ncbi:MAG: hypothetical protein ACWGSQ_19050 [Longimicrobiales bacterium]
MRALCLPIPGPASRGNRLLLVTLTCVVWGGSTFHAPLRAQESGGSAFAVVGATALGLFSGSALGLAGSLVPCSQRVRGLTCTRVSAAVGGLVGGVSGAIIGATDTDQARAHARNAGIGALAGGITGFLLKDLVRHYGWLDAGAGVMLGAAFGAAPVGAGVGFVSGAAVGTLLWQLSPSFEVADAVGMALGGLALGGLGSWIVSAVQSSEKERRLEVTVPLSLLF